MHLNSSDVANNLEDFPTKYGCEKRPCAEIETEVCLDDEDKGEDAEVESISNKRRVVAYLGQGEGAGGQGAELGIVEEGCVCVGDVHVD